MVVYVNGEKVKEQEVKEEAERLKPHHDNVFADKPEEEREKQLYQWSRENVIERVLLRQAARRDFQDIPSARVEKTYQQLLESHGGEESFYKNSGLSKGEEPHVKKEIEEQLRVTGLLESIVKDLPEPSEEEIRAYYEENLDDFSTPELVKASHIVKHPGAGTDMEELRKEMEQIHSRLKQGEDFAELADENSECEDEGGDLGYFPRGKMVPAFEEVVFGMEAGEISEVFQTEFGYHIAKVTDKKPACPAPLGEVRDKVIEALSEERKQKAIENFIDKEKEKSSIEEK